MMTPAEFKASLVEDNKTIIVRFNHVGIGIGLPVKAKVKNPNKYNKNKRTN